MRKPSDASDDGVDPNIFPKHNGIDLPGGPDYPSFGAVSYVQDQDPKEQRTKCTACLPSKPVYYTALSVNLVYTLLVSVLFAGFAYRRAETLGEGIWYITSSFAMNAPMAWFFALEAIMAVQRLQKKEPLFMTAFALALVLSLGTTLAGLQVATESVSSFTFLPAPFVIALTLLSAFNTWSTRFIGSAYLLHSTFLLVRDSFNRLFSRHSEYYNFLNDLNRYGSQCDITQRKNDPTNTKLSPQDVKAFIPEFYGELMRKGLHPGATWTDTMKDAAVVVATLSIISLFIINMQPLWLKLTVEGIAGFGAIKSWQTSVAFVWYAATSNEFFYMRSAIKFFPSIISIVGNAGPKAKAAISITDNRLGKVGIAVALVAAVFLWAVLAYYSGEGYGEDGLKAAQDGFGSIAENTWFLWTWTNLFNPSGNATFYANFVATTSAGVIVNGGAALRFMMKRLSFFQPEKVEEGEIGTEAVKNFVQETVDAGDFDKLSTTKNKIECNRKRADPISTLWQSAGCRISTLWQSARCRSGGGMRNELLPLKKFPGGAL